MKKKVETEIDLKNLRFNRKTAKDFEARQRIPAYAITLLIAFTVSIGFYFRAEVRVRLDYWLSNKPRVEEPVKP